MPPEAYASALAGLPAMGPARLAAVLDALAPPLAWAKVRRGELWRDPAVVAALGPRGSAIVADWHATAATTDVADVWSRVLDAQVGVAMRGGAGYPPALLDDVEPPAILFHRGALDCLASGPRVAIVGTRRCTGTGAGIAFELGRELSRAGVAVVSGLALGIDAAAHRGALVVPWARPVGVAGSGLDVIYPPSQGPLWEAVSVGGVLLSEAPLGARPERWRFPARNRIIAALSDLVVVVESHSRGGSLHTVDEADRRGIDVMVVPGSVRSPASRGANDLLAEGRAPVRDADDVLMNLGLTTTQRTDRADDRPPPVPEDRAVLEAVGWHPSSLDQLAVRTALPVPELAGALDRLSTTGWIDRQGSWYERIAAGAS